MKSICKNGCVRELKILPVWDAKWGDIARDFKAIFYSGPKKNPKQFPYFCMYF